MNEITINKQNVQLKTVGGKAVVAFKDIDAIHERPCGTARKRFNDNRKHFVENEDYFVLKTDEAKKYGITAPNGVIMLTESGYLMLAKSFTDDLAWKVQRELVNCYFRVQPEPDKPAEKPYEYVEKQFRGLPVLSTLDMAQLIGVSRSTINYWLRRHAVFGKDYDFLLGDALESFKESNPSISSLVSHYEIIYKSGFDKLCKAYRREVDMPFKMIEQRAAVTPKKEYAIVRGNSYVQTLISRIKKELVAVDVLIDKYNRHNIKLDDMDSLRRTLGELGLELGSDISGLAREKLSTTTECKN